MAGSKDAQLRAQLTVLIPDVRWVVDLPGVGVCFHAASFRVCGLLQTVSVAISESGTYTSHPVQSADHLWLKLPSAFRVVQSTPLSVLLSIRFLPVYQPKL